MSERIPAPVWLRVLGGAVLLVLLAGTLYALAVGVLRFGSIGV